MERPIPPPRLKSASRVRAFVQNDSPDRKSIGRDDSEEGIVQQVSNIIHVAEVHGRGANDSSDDDDIITSEKTEKKRRKVRRKSTFTLSRESPTLLRTKDSFEGHKEANGGKRQKSGRRSETETLSESSDDPSSRSIKVIPLKPHKKQPKGSETETLSDSSDEVKSDVISPVPMARRNTVISVHKPQSPVLGETSPPVPLPRKKSLDNLLSPKSSEEVSATSNENISHHSPKSFTSSSIEYKDLGMVVPPRIRRSKRKRRSKERDDGSPLEDSESLRSKNSVTTRSPGSPTNDEVVCVTVHRCDPLKTNINKKPFVRLHVLDVSSGKELATLSQYNKPLPVSTEPHDFKVTRSIIPFWDEDLFVVAPSSNVVSQDTVLIFEILDSDAQTKGSVKSNHYIAWAFLKLVTANGALNTGRLLRLQLFKPGKFRKDETALQTFLWWTKGLNNPYKSTLYVTVNPVRMEDFIKISQTKVDPEKLMDNSKSSVISLPRSEEKSTVDSVKETVEWSRIPSQFCKLPNSLMTTVDGGPDGALSIAYSHSGLFLAAPTSPSISIYTFKGKLHCSFSGHQGLVYCIVWSSDDRYILSASADSTVCLWDVKQFSRSAVQIFPHPSYVYSCCWFGNDKIVTGCYDGDVRLWKRGLRDPLQHLTFHEGQVNCVLAIEDHTIISGDSKGLIVLWGRHSDGTLVVKKELKILEICGTIINKLRLHPGQKRLLVHTRDSLLRMVELTSGSVIQWFQGGVNTKLQTDSCFCSCGNKVLACGEDSTISVWDANTGKQLALYSGLFPNKCAASIAFHPHDHMMSVVAHSAHSYPTIQLAVFNKLATGKDVGLHVIQGNKQDNRLTVPHILKSDTGSSTESVADTKKKFHDNVFSFLKSRHKKGGGKGQVNKGFISEVADISWTLQPLKTSTPYKSQVNDKDVDDNDSEHSDSRLMEIIHRMDKIILAASPSKG